MAKEFTAETNHLLAVTLARICPFEWARYNIYIKDDIYGRPPSLIFRFQDEPKEIYTKINSCLESFKGNSHWVLYQSFYSKRNYVLEPLEFCCVKKLFYEKEKFIHVKEIIGMTQYKKICDRAIKDIPLLCEHIKDFFGLNE